MHSGEILGKKLLIITAHPDDESYFAAGTVYANKQAGGTTDLICATRGEKGVSHLINPVEEDELKDIRARELQNAAKIIGINKLIHLDYPDGKVMENESKLFDGITELLPALNPELILSFGPDGITGHRDHIAVSNVAQKIAKTNNLQLIKACVPSAIFDSAKSWLKTRKRTKDHYEDEYELSPSNLSIPIDGEVKLQALHCYVSQLDANDPFRGFPDEVAENFLKEECFCTD